MNKIMNKYPPRGKGKNRNGVNLSIRVSCSKCGGIMSIDTESKITYHPATLHWRYICNSRHSHIRWIGEDYMEEYEIDE